MRLFLFGLAVVAVAMFTFDRTFAAHTMDGVIYDRATCQMRRVIIPTDDAELKLRGTVDAGEAMVKVQNTGKHDPKLKQALRISVVYANAVRQVCAASHR